MPKPPRLARCNSRRASRLRAGYRAELLARHGLSALPTSAEIFLAAAGNAAVEGDAAKVARALDAADRSAGAAARAAKGRPARPAQARPAPPRYFPPVKSGGGFNSENAGGVAEPAADPLAERLAWLEAELAKGADR